MPGWELLDQYLVELRRSGAKSFLRNYDHPFLLLQAPKKEGDLDGDTNTTPMSTALVNLAATMTPEELFAAAKAEPFRVFRILKQATHDWPDRITIGRGRGNDLVLPHMTISKLHAYFVVLKDGRGTVTDVGSRNGSRLNDSHLAPKRTATLVSGDKLTFGAIITTYYEVRTFCSFLTRLIGG